jgi:hypothetical protein
MNLPFAVAVLLAVWVQGGKAEEILYWINADGKSHIASCRFYGTTKEGYNTKDPNEGDPCGLCRKQIKSSEPQPAGLEEQKQTAPEGNQVGKKAADEKSKEEKQGEEDAQQKELENLRAEREGAEAVYLLEQKRAEEMAKKANASKKAKDVVAFERQVSVTLTRWELFYTPKLQASREARGLSQKDVQVMNAKFGNPFERERNQVKANLENLLDESLRHSSP